MNKTIRYAAVICILFFLVPLLPASIEHSAYEQTSEESVSGHLRNIVTASEGFPLYTSGSETVYSSSLLERFYSKRNYRAAWSGDDGVLPHADALVQAIKEVDVHGLVPAYYHLKEIEYLIELVRSAPIRDSGALAELDLLLTDAFLMMGCHFSAGCVDPVTSEAEWHVKRRVLEIDEILEDGLSTGAISEALWDILPSQGRYSDLKDKLIDYREITEDGGWPVVITDRTLKRGVEGRDVADLKRHLLFSGDADSFDKKGEHVFDGKLERAVVYFQKRHGLTPDGIVGPRTLGEVNVSSEMRSRQIEVNLERLRWIARNLGHQYIIVNIADYKFKLIEYGEVVMSMDVVVGKPFMNTPVFSKKMKYMIINPTWNIPMSIGTEEILPNIMKNRDYLASKHIKIYTGWSADAEEIGPGTIDWEGVNAENLPFTFRQGPGPLNPLGNIKFMMPNRFNVYLHDTPAKGVFLNNSRAFSHGCIRLKRPVDLAEYLLKDNPEWPREKILSAIEGDEEIRIDLTYPIDVFIVYLTAWVDLDGSLQLRRDIYERDDRLYRALRKIPDTLAQTAGE